MPRTETEMLWHVKGEFSQSPPMWKQIRNTQERTLFMATAAKTTTKPAGTPVETGVSGSELWKLADTLRGNIDAAEYKHIVLPLMFLKYISETGPGKSYRKGISLLEITRRFDTEDKAEVWFTEQRWANGVACPHCGSFNVAVVASRKPQPFRCRDCRKHFSVKTGTVLHSSNISLDKWAIAFYLYMTNLKGVSSMKLHRDLGITQKSAWRCALDERHRICPPPGCRGVAL